MGAGYQGFTIIPIVWDISVSTTISNEVNLNGKRILSLWMDPDFIAGNLTFSAAIELARARKMDVTAMAKPRLTAYHSVEDDNGNAILIAVVPDKQYVLNGGETHGIHGLQWVKFTNSEAQTTADKTCYLVCIDE